MSRGVMANPTREIPDFLLFPSTPQQVINLQASEAAQERIHYLLDGNRNSTLTQNRSVSIITFANGV
jgi:hypothetical protein